MLLQWFQMPFVYAVHPQAVFAMPQISAQRADSVAEASPEQAEFRPHQRVQIEESSLVSAYSNFCRVTATADEIIIDCGVNSHPTGGPPREPVRVQQRIVVSYYTAKRLISALQMSIQRHEAVFGVVETDISKRVRSDTRYVNTTSQQVKPQNYDWQMAPLPVRLEFTKAVTDEFVEKAINALRIEIEREGGTLTVVGDSAAMEQRSSVQRKIST